MAIFVPNKRFRRVDLPTLGGPVMAMKPDKKPDSIESLEFIISIKAIEII
jgi:hypothetical protein